MDYVQAFAIILSIIFVIVIVIGMYVLVAKMAKNRHREVAVWVLLSFLISPILIMIILLCIGDDTRYRDYESS